MGWFSKLFGQGVPSHLKLIRLTLLLLLAAASAYRVWLVFAYNPMDAIWSDPGRHWILGTRPLERARVRGGAAARRLPAARRDRHAVTP